MKKHDDQSAVPADPEKEELKKQVEEWKGKYLRALADYQNLERRTSEFRSAAKEQSVKEVMHGVLLFLDEIIRANRHLKDEGLMHALSAFDATLRAYHVRKTDVQGKPFDPVTMECVEVVPGETDNAVTEEVRPGYMIGDNVLRPAWVKVSKKQSN